MNSSKIPKHTLIEKDLLSKIEDGTYKQNTIIPKETELVEIYNVSRPTVRQAVQSLVDKGLLARRKKRGTIVLRNKISQEFTHVIESFNAEAKNKGLSPKTSVLSLQKESPSQDVIEHLNIDSNDSVIKLIRLRYVDNQPIVLVTSYLPFKYFSKLESFDFENGSLYSALEKEGYPVINVHRKLEVESADETVADMLNINENDPIFYFHTVGYAKNKIPVEYSIARYRGDINSFEISIDR